MSHKNDRDASEDDRFATRIRGDLDNHARAVSEGGATTLFQPGAMVDSILSAATDTGSNTWVLQDSAPTAPLKMEKQPYLMVVGAPAGFERIPIFGGGMVFGRDEGHVRLDDPSISSRHFQIDAVGNDLFVRDLGSTNGTLLNGHPVRYSEILPGDELRVGRTILVLRVEGDGISRRRP